MKQLKKLYSFFSLGTALLLLLNTTLMAQGRAGGNENTPNWVKIMNDPTANYNEAIVSFENFWKNKTIPVQEKEVFRNFRTDGSLQIRKTEGAARELAFEYKKFLKWKRRVSPYVLADGSILSAEQRLEIWRNKTNK